VQKKESQILSPLKEFWLLMKTPLYLIMMNALESFEQKADAIGKSVSQRTTEGIMVAGGIGLILGILTQPELFRMSPFLSPVDTVIGTVRFFYITVFMTLANIGVIALTWKDTPDNPDEFVDTKWVHLFRAITGGVSGMAMAFMTILFTLSMWSQAHALYWPVFIQLWIMAVQFRHFIKFTRRNREVRTRNEIEIALLGTKNAATG
jgi:hypothetical protein